MLDNEFARWPGDLQRKEPDLVKVIRCGNCANVAKQSNVAYCSYFGCYMDIDGYCCYGRKREG